MSNFGPRGGNMLPQQGMAIPIKPDTIVITTTINADSDQMRVFKGDPTESGHPIQYGGIVCYVDPSKLNPQYGRRPTRTTTGARDIRLPVVGGPTNFLSNMADLKENKPDDVERMRRFVLKAATFVGVSCVDIMTRNGLPMYAQEGGMAIVKGVSTVAIPTDVSDHMIQPMTPLTLDVGRPISLNGTGRGQKVYLFTLKPAITSSNSLFREAARLCLDPDDPEDLIFKTFQKFIEAMGGSSAATTGIEVGGGSSSFYRTAAAAASAMEARQEAPSSRTGTKRSTTSLDVEFEEEKRPTSMSGERQIPLDEEEETAEFLDTTLGKRFEALQDLFRAFSEIARQAPVVAHALASCTEANRDTNVKLLNVLVGH